MTSSLTAFYFFIMTQNQPIPCYHRSVSYKITEGVTMWLEHQ